MPEASMYRPWKCPHCEQLASGTYSQRICSECKKVRPQRAWLKTREASYPQRETWVAEASELQGFPIRCPKCDLVVTTPGTPEYGPHSPDEQGDVAGWRQVHNCGAEILIIND